MNAPQGRSDPGAWAYSVEAEQSLLGALMLNSQALEQIRASLRAEHFYVEDHASIFRAICFLAARGEQPDFVTVTAHLQNAAPEVLQRAGGPAYLAQLAQNVPSALHANRYADLVRDRALSRRLDALALDLSTAVRGPSGRDISALALEARARIAGFADDAAGARQLRAFNAPDFIAQKLPELEVLLAPWLFQKNLCMVHARRGVGKTHFAMACAFAVAGGGKYLGWQAPRARDVLYVDGEMPEQLMQRRLRELAAGGSIGALPGTLRIVTPDPQDKPMPDIATLAGQAEIDALVRDDTALIVLDNLSCLMRSGGAENESESWVPVSEWLLRHRRAGRAILLVHHSGKSGAQRGASKREDLLDVVVNLRRPPEYEEADGAVFDIYFEKARSLTGEDIEPIRATLSEDAGGGHNWRVGSVNSANQARVLQLWEAGGVTLIDIARELAIDKSYAHRTLERAMREGRLNREYPARRRKQA